MLKVRFTILLLALVNPLIAETITGRVVGIADGDTVTVLDAAKVQHKIRLSGIDAPEKAQAFGNRSKESLSDLAFDKTVTVETDKRDRYGREVGKVLVNGRDVNLIQVESGMAWHYKAYEREQSPGDRNCTTLLKSTLGPPEGASGAMRRRCRHGSSGGRSAMGNSKVELPDTADAAVRLLRGLVPDAEQARIASLKEDELIGLDIGLDVWIRNNLGLWQGNTVLLEATGAGHADDASGIIIRAFWLALRGDLPKVR